MCRRNSIFSRSFTNVNTLQAALKGNETLLIVRVRETVNSRCDKVKRRDFPTYTQFGVFWYSNLGR